MQTIHPRELLLDMYNSAVAVVSAHACLPDFLPKAPHRSRTLFIGAERAAWRIRDCL